jgi:hypothetical protein
MSDTCCILTYSGHCGSTPLFITNWVEVLNWCVIHINQINPPHSSYNCPSPAHTCCLYNIFQHGTGHSSSSPPLHFSANCSFTFMDIKLQTVFTEFWLLRILMLKVFETRAYVQHCCHVLSTATWVDFALLI